LKGVALTRKYFPPGKEEMPEVLADLRSNQFRRPLAWTAFALMVTSLEKNLLANQSVPLCDYSWFDVDTLCNAVGSQTMQIDS